MIGICNSDIRMNICYQLLKQHKECILIDDGNYIPIHLDMLILPMSGLKDDHTMTFKGVNMKVSSDFFDMVKPDGVIVTAQVNELLQNTKRKIIDLNDYEDFSISNARYTAEGVLFLLLDNTKKSLLDLEIDLIGYGRCGKIIYSLLKGLGCNVRVIRRVVDTKHADFISVDEYRYLKPKDIIINASRNNEIDDSMIRKMDDTLVINLVSNHIFNELLMKSRNSRVLHAGALPALMTPYSSARCLYETLFEVSYES